MAMNVTATPSYDSISLRASMLTWWGTNKSIVWAYKRPTDAVWNEVSETVTGSPESLSHTFPNLNPGTQYSYRVTKINDGSMVQYTSTTTTLAEIGELVVDGVTRTSIKVRFEDYVPATYGRIAKFSYSETTEDGSKPSEYGDGGEVYILPNTTTTDVSSLITGLRYHTTYDVYMRLYKVGDLPNQRQTLIDTYSVNATTMVGSADATVTIESIKKRYDTTNLTVKMNTDYEGLYRFVLLISDDASGTYWHTLVLPNLETEFVAANILPRFIAEASGQTPTYTHKDDLDIKAGIIVESDTEAINTPEYQYKVGNAVDWRKPHTSLPEGITLYGETTPVNVTFPVTPDLISPYLSGHEAGVLVSDMITLASILHEKYETPYKDYSIIEWRRFQGMGSGINTKLHQDVQNGIPLETLIEQMNEWCEGIERTMGEAAIGNPVWTSQGTLVKNMESLAQELTTAPTAHNLDADPGEPAAGSYFRQLADFIRQVL